MRYLILGLGIYGSNLARDLTDLGHEVIGADISQAKIDDLKDYINTVYHLDLTEESALSLLPLNNVDLVIVAIGENFGASIKVVAMLKKLKVKHIYARAIDSLHESILRGFEIDRIITPEQRAARDLTHEMALGTHARSLSIDDNYFVLRFDVPKAFVGLKYSDINFLQSYKLNLIALTRSVMKENLMGIKQPTQQMMPLDDNDIIAVAGDQLTCMGSRKAFASFFKSISSKI